MTIQELSEYLVNELQKEIEEEKEIIYLFRQTLRKNKNPNNLKFHKQMNRDKKY